MSYCDKSSGTYIYKITEFILDPVSDLGEGDLPLAQLGFRNQLQLGAVLEAIPTGRGQAYTRNNSTSYRDLRLHGSVCGDLKRWGDVATLIHDQLYWVVMCLDSSLSYRDTRLGEFHTGGGWVHGVHVTQT